MTEWRRPGEHRPDDKGVELGPSGSTRLGPPGAGGQARPGHTSHKLQAALLLVVWPIARHRLPAKGRYNVTRQAVCKGEDYRVTDGTGNWNPRGGEGGGAPVGILGDPRPHSTWVWKKAGPCLLGRLVPGTAARTGPQNRGWAPGDPRRGGCREAGQRGSVRSQPSAKPSRATCFFNKSPRGPVCLIHEGRSKFP